MDDKLAIGVDLGGTKLEVALVDAFGAIHKRHSVPTDVKGGDKAVVSQIIELVRNLQQNTSQPIKGVGLGIAGQIDAESGVVHFAPNLQWHEVPLKQALSDALKLPISITNDVRAATLGEWLYGAGRGCNDLICLFVGTGIGSGIISGGKLLTGGSNTAGEVGHMTVDLYGPPCTCGSTGCLEALAGGWAIAARAKEIVKEDAQAGKLILKLVDGHIDNITAKVVAQAYHEGDALARLIIDEVTHALIVGIANLINAFNPVRIILGGGILKSLPELIERIDTGVRRRALGAACASLKIVNAYLTTDAGVVGAAALVLSQA